MSQLVGVKEGEDGNIEETECCEVGFVQGESARWESSYTLQEQRLAAIIRTLATKEPTELNWTFTSSDFETNNDHCWTTAQPLGMLVVEHPRWGPSSNFSAKPIQNREEYRWSAALWFFQVSSQNMLL